MGVYTMEQLMNKELQIKLAIKHKFNVPYSVCVSKPFCVPEAMVYPCIVKPLISCMGDKRDILIAQNSEDLKDILENRVTFSESVIIQQFIQRDYEYCMMGCAFKNGHVYIPLTDRPVKFNHKLQDTSYINYIEPVTGEIAVEVEKIKTLMNEVGYVGLFSVEFMHDSNKDIVYFTEINFRNDGTNSFIVHCGVNLPYLHYQDLLDLPHKIYTPISESKKYIWEGIHFSNLIRNGISFREWFSDLKGVDGFLYYFKDDKAPFFYQFVNKILRKFHLA
jgi:predicted ATP-grasp superfamily ATP-dependent carboligase